MAQINVAELFKETRLKLKLNWIAGLDGGHNQLNSEKVTKPSLALIGHLNFVHPNRVQVLGCAEMDYLNIVLDPEKNNQYKGETLDISTAESKVRILVIPTNEEYEIASQCYAQLTTQAIQSLPPTYPLGY